MSKSIRGGYVPQLDERRFGVRDHVRIRGVANRRLSRRIIVGAAVSPETAPAKPYYLRAPDAKPQKDPLNAQPPSAS